LRIHQQRHRANGVLALTLDLLLEAPELQQERGERSDSDDARFSPAVPPAEGAASKPLPPARSWTTRAKVRQ